MLLAAITAGIHLMIGVERLTYYLLASRPFTDPRQSLFVLSGAAIFLGITLWYRGLRRDVVYAAGILLMLGYLVGWLILGGPEGQFAWEAGHHGSPLVGLFEHLTADFYLIVTKTVETTLLGILIALLYDARMNDGETNEGATGEDGTRDVRTGDDGTREAGDERAATTDTER